MGNLHVATIFILALNVLMWFVTLSMQNMNPGGTTCYNVEGSVIGNSISGSGTNITLSNDALADMPAAQGSVQVGGTTNIFTDIFNSAISWFKTAPGIKYVYGVVAAPYNILKCMNLPNQFLVGLGIFWYLITFLALLSFLWGRD